MKNFTEVIERAAQGESPVLAVIAPYDEATLSAVLTAVEEDLLRPVLIGEKEKIAAALQSMGHSSEEFELIDSAQPIKTAIESVREGKCDFLMKGKVTTPAVMSACLSKSTGLNLGRSICAVTVSSIPAYGKLLAVSDAALNIAPGLEQKIDFTKNLIEVLQALEVETPKVAILSSMEEVSLKIPSSMDAAVIAQMSRSGQIKGAVVDGPLALDNIVSRQSAEKKGINSQVAGDADGIIVPSIECGNALIKSFIYFAGATNATVAVGAAAPIVLPSRAGKKETKLAALAVGALLAKKKKELRQ